MARPMLLTLKIAFDANRLISHRLYTDMSVTWMAWAAVAAAICAVQWSRHPKHSQRLYKLATTVSVLILASGYFQLAFAPVMPHLEANAYRLIQNILTCSLCAYYGWTAERRWKVRQLALLQTMHEKRASANAETPIAPGEWDP